MINFYQVNNYETHLEFTWYSQSLISLWFLYFQNNELMKSRVRYSFLKRSFKFGIIVRWYVDDIMTRARASFWTHVRQKIQEKKFSSIWRTVQIGPNISQNANKNRVNDVRRIEHFRTWYLSKDVYLNPSNSCFWGFGSHTTASWFLDPNMDVWRFPRCGNQRPFCKKTCPVDCGNFHPPWTSVSTH